MGSGPVGSKQQHRSRKLDVILDRTNPLHAADKKSGQCGTSSSHSGREKSTEKYQPVSEGISSEPRIVSSHTASQKIAKKNKL